MTLISEACLQDYRGLLPKSDDVGKETLRAFTERTEAQRVPLPRDDYFRLLGAFDERTRIRSSLSQELNRLLNVRNHVPQRHYLKWNQANRVCEPLRLLLNDIIKEQDSMRESIKWETEHGHH